MNDCNRGFSLLEALFASLILLSGMLWIGQLTRSTIEGLSSGTGLAERPEIAERLLQDQIESLRARTDAPVAPPTVPSLVSAGATYSVTVTSLGSTSARGVTRRRYQAVVSVKTPGATVSVECGRVFFDKAASGSDWVGL